MVYVKSFLAGIVALVSVLFLAIIAFIGWGLWMRNQSSTVGPVSYDVTRSWIATPILIAAASVFLAGFTWQFRRSRRVP